MFIDNLCAKMHLNRLGVSLTDVSCTIMCVFFFVSWSTATWKFSVSNCGIIALFSIMSLLSGATCLRILKLDLQSFGTKFIFGYALLSTLIFFFYLILNLRLTSSFICALLLLGAVVCAVYFLTLESSIAGNTIDNLAVFICLIGTTFWVQDSFKPFLLLNESVVIKPWSDSFYHASILRIFFQETWSTFQNPAMVDATPRIYHYASYLFPALLIDQETGMTAFEAFNLIHVPFGLFLMGLASYALVRSWWGNWPAILGIIFLLCIPNAAHHGLANKWFSFHWLVIISPTLSYGIAVISIAWFLIFEAIKQSTILLIIPAFLFGIMSALFKAQIFMANSFLIAVYPIVFWNHPNWKLKTILFLLVLVFFIVGIHLSHQWKSVPFINLDFSALDMYYQTIVSMIENSKVRSFFTSYFNSKFLAVPAVLLIYLGTFGLFGVVYPIFLVKLLDSMPTAMIIFPGIMMANYLIMSTALSFDKNGLGMPEELLHRPFVWTYFILVSWVGGAVWLLMRDAIVANRTLLVLFIVSCVSFFAVPIYLGNQIQIGPEWGRHHAWVRVPRGLFDACHFLRKHSLPNDIIQDSKADPTLMISCLSERQAFVTDQATKLPRFSQKRAKAGEIKSFTSEEALIKFTRENRINWFIFHPDDQVSWPRSLWENPTFQSEGYRVYNFLH